MPAGEPEIHVVGGDYRLTRAGARLLFGSGEPEREESMIDLGGGMVVPLRELLEDVDEEECPICFHGASNHDENGCDVPGCDCEGP